MMRLNKPPLLLFFILSFFYMFPRIITSIAYAGHFELPLRLTLILLFPIMAFITPIVAIVYGKKIENVKLAFISCFLSVAIWEILYFVFIGSIAYISSLEIIRILILSFSLGLIGTSGGLAKERMNHKLKYILMIVGVVLWLVLFGEGIIRWLALLMGGPLPN